MRLPRPGVHIFDVAILVLLLAAAIVLPLAAPTVSTDEARYAVISADGVESRYPIRDDAVIRITSNSCSYTVTICDKKVSITDADCRDKVCLHTPPAGEKGGSIICVPGRLIITVETGGGADDECDSVAGR